MQLRRLPLLMLFIMSPATARETIGVFGDWGAFKQRDTCYTTAAPAQSTGARKGAAYLTVSIWPGQASAPQVMIAAGTAVTTVTLRVAEQGFHPVVRGDAAWMPDSHGDQLLIAALAAANSLSIEYSSRRGRIFTDRYSLNGFNAAWKAAIAACK